MITVAGFNTAIDRRLRIGALRAGAVHRALDEQVHPGGKGLHVAQTIAALGERVQLVGLVDAAHRELIGQHLARRGVQFHGVEIGESLRDCLAVQEADGRITEILGAGPQLDAAQCEALLATLRHCSEDSALVILSGSLPRGLPLDTYAELAAEARAAGRLCLVDASGDVLRYALSARPTLIKPNQDEIAELLGRAVNDLDVAVIAVRELQAGGIATPVLTMGALGALAADADGVWHAAIELAEVRNPVGSGDCLLAGMAVGIARGMGLEQSLRLGVACGAANALGEETGMVEPRTVDELLLRVRMRRQDV